MKLFRTHNYSHAGFTLMEVMVSVSIFAIIVTVGIGSLLAIFSTLKKTRVDQQTMDSLSFVMDTMTRRIRTGYDYEQNSPSSITFKDQDYNGQEITIEAQANPNDPLVLQLFMTDSDGVQYDITPSNLKITGFLVEVVGTSDVDGLQPMVQIHLEGVMRGKIEVPLAIQAAVSQRYLDFPGSLTGGSLVGSGGDPAGDPLEIIDSELLLTPPEVGGPIIIDISPIQII